MALIAAAIDPDGQPLRIVPRGGRCFFGLPRCRAHAARTIRLYQPQSLPAKVFAKTIAAVVACGAHNWVFPRGGPAASAVTATPALPVPEPDSLGMMMGNPAHVIKRAILAYATADGWEVAKAAVGAEGKDLLQREAACLASLPAHIPGCPGIRGLHHAGELTILRMPYLMGNVLKPGENPGVTALLDSWLLPETARPITSFPEWIAITAALSATEAGRRVLPRLERFVLQPAIRHGDFARWNLLDTGDAGLMAMDWEWAQMAGLPGCDLAHYFAQDARLVHRLSPAEVCQRVTSALESPRNMAYLDRCGWNGDGRAVMISMLAYTVGTGQQHNHEVLAAALA